MNVIVAPIQFGDHVWMGNDLNVHVCVDTIINIRCSKCGYILEGSSYSVNGKINIIFYFFPEDTCDTITMNEALQ